MKLLIGNKRATLIKANELGNQFYLYIKCIGETLES